MTQGQLKAARKELGMNQGDLAKRLRTSRSGYVKWERGERPIPGICETAIELLLRIDRMQMQAIKEKIANSFPGTGTR
jgi:DNA-binding XRE family transcriptional regulator